MADKLIEYRTKSDIEITNPKILKYIDECIKTMDDIGYYIPRSHISCRQSNATKTFGSAAYDFPLMQDVDIYGFGTKKWGYYILTLSSYMFDEPEKVIKNTIYHELCHIVAMQDDLENERLYYDYRDDRWHITSGETLAGHGPRWQQIADKVSNAIGDKISRTDSYSKHTEVGKKAAEKVKHVFECPNCHAKIRFQKTTRFCREFNKKDEDGNPLWWCARCKRNEGKKIAFVEVEE